MNSLLLKGTLFEMDVADKLSKAFPEGRVITDLVIDSPQLKKTTQIDVILVLEEGIFVIEAKNWDCWVRGSYNSKHWTGMGSMRRVMTVFSPVDQNVIHQRALKRLFAQKKGWDYLPPFYSLIVFPDVTELYTPYVVEVCNYSMMVEHINGLRRDAAQLIDVESTYKFLRDLKEE